MKNVILSVFAVLFTLLILEKFLSFTKAAPTTLNEALQHPASNQKQEEKESSSAKDVFLVVRSGYLSEKGLMFLNDSYDYKKSKVTLLIDTNEDGFKGLTVRKFLNMKIMVKAVEEETRSGKLQHRVESITYVKENK